jgi:hypothetical protein
MPSVHAICSATQQVGVLVGNCDGFVGNRMLKSYQDEVSTVTLQSSTPKYNSYRAQYCCDCYTLSSAPSCRRLWEHCAHTHAHMSSCFHNVLHFCLHASRNSWVTLQLNAFLACNGANANSARYA